MQFIELKATVYTNRLRKHALKSNTLFAYMHVCASMHMCVGTCVGEIGCALSCNLTE